MRMQPQSAPDPGRKRRPITIDSIDRRTKAGRKIGVVMRSLQRQLGRMPGTAERLAMERVATAFILAESTRVRILTGDSSVSVDMATRADGTYRRAYADFCALVKAPRPELGGGNDLAAIFNGDSDGP